MLNNPIFFKLSALKNGLFVQLLNVFVETSPNKSASGSSPIPKLSMTIIITRLSIDTSFEFYVNQYLLFFLFSFIMCIFFKCFILGHNVVVVIRILCIKRIVRIFAKIKFATRISANYKIPQ